MGEDHYKYLEKSNEILNLFESIQTGNVDVPINSVIPLDFPVNSELKNNEVCFYKIKQLSFDEDYPRREAFENVLLSMNNNAFNFIYILTGTPKGIELCIGVVQNQNENQPILGKKFSAVNYGEIIANVFEGNFNGSILEKMNSSELEKLIGLGVKEYDNAGIIIGIPSVNKKENGEDYDFQGIDRLVNSMLGLEWRIVLVCESVSKNEIISIRDDVFELYNRLSLYAKRTIQHSENDGNSLSFGTSQSSSKSKNWGYSKSKGKSGDKHNEKYSSGWNSNEQNSEGESRDSQHGKNQGISFNRGSSNSVTLEIANKHAEEMMKYINENLLERIKLGYSKGLYKSSIYYMAKGATHANRLKVGIMSLFQGNNTSYSPLFAQNIDLEKSKNISLLNTFQNQYIERPNLSNDALLLLGRPFYNQYIGLSSYLTTSEVSLIAGLPQKEVPGLSLKEGVSFGLNVKNIDNVETINLGVMVQKGRELKQVPFFLSRNSMAKHTFIGGVTGSGKTTTCHRLLSEANMPFLVIEPAKTEYRTLIRDDSSLVVFTLGNEMVAPFRINPFELIKGEVISAHVDMIKAAFTSAFPMEASMPQILEEAIYNIYEQKGWNIDTNENDIWGDKAFNSQVNSFPILSDLLEEMRNVVESKHFSAQMQADYIGSLVSRLSNLTVGSKGRMLNCEHSTDFEFIAHNNIILEMEELKSPEDKALIMGVILSRLSATIKEEHKKNPTYKHITLIEEAHRLLSKVEYGDCGSKKIAVETFTDLLAEVRKYGEGLIIVDQIPNKLAPEVLKNTNTKIIHKILAHDDKQAVGDTMLMDDKQKEYLSALNVGNAIIFSENTEKPVHVHISKISDTNEIQIENDIVKLRFLDKKNQFGSSYELPEVLEILNLFSNIAHDIRRMNIDIDKNKKLLVKIEQIAKKYKISKEEVWRKVILRYDKATGKSKACSVKQNERVSSLVNFFSKIFSNDKFSIDDIYDNRSVCCIYLM